MTTPHPTVQRPIAPQSGTLEYIPADTDGLLVIASGNRVLVLTERPSAALVGALWQAVAAADALQSVLDLLTRGGLPATPSFAFADWAHPTTPTRVIVRGALSLRILDSDGMHGLTGSGFSTWVERDYPGATEFEIGASAESRRTDRLPFESGVVIAASIRVTMTPNGIVAARPIEHEIEVDLEATFVEFPHATVRDADPGADSITDRDPATANETPGASPHDESHYDLLFGETIFRGVSEEPTSASGDAIVLASDVLLPDETEGETEVETSFGDHDGETVFTSDLAKLRGNRAVKAAATIAPTPVAVAPSFSVSLVHVDGTREQLERRILIGRAPSVSKISGGDLPMFITLGGDDQDISRNHAQVALEGDTVVVTDLHSRNGTLIVLPGKSAQKLRAGEPTAVIIGTIIDFGGGITLTVEQD